VSSSVFFEEQTYDGRVGHGGIVTDVKPNGEFDFIHASTVSGVIISKSTEPYYTARYLRGGRVIEENAILKSTMDEKKKSSPSESTNRQTGIRSQKSTTIAEAIGQEEREEERIIIVQTDSTKTPRLTERKIDDNHETETDTGKEANDHIPTPKPHTICPHLTFRQALFVSCFHFCEHPKSPVRCKKHRLLHQI
jgi:hypothetical protein